MKENKLFQDQKPRVGKGRRVEHKSQGDKCICKSYMKIWLLLLMKRELQVGVVTYHILEGNDLIQACNQIAIS